MPSKALLRPEEALDEARRIPGAAEAADRSARRRRRAAPPQRGHPRPGRRGAAAMAREARRRASPRRSAPDRASARSTVDGTAYTARRAVVIATGTEPFIPPDPRAGRGARRGRTAKERPRTTVPARLLVLGGGAGGGGTRPGMGDPRLARHARRGRPAHPQPRGGVRGEAGPRRRWSRTASR